jgi:cell division protein FtsQ
MSDQFVSDVEILLNKNASVYFLTEEDITSYLNELSIHQGTTRIRDIDLAQLERMIESNGYVADAEVYIDALCKLHVLVEQRVPVLRIMNSSGVSYYVDASGNKMPLHPKFTARVIVASGQVLASNRLQDTVGQKQLNDLVFLANEILQDDFLSHLIVQIWVDDNQEIHLIPMIAQEDILLGTITDANSKLQNLKSFYTQTNSNHLNNYSLINLKFKNQVVATKRSNTQKTNPIK